MRASAVALLAVALASPSGGTACGTSGRPTTATPTASAVSEQRVEVPVGGSVSFGSGDGTLTFERVKEDSRCPKGVTCVWEGDAVAVLSVRLSGETTTLELHTHPTQQREARHGGFLIRLLELRPYPAAGERIDPSSYRARLETLPE